MLILSHDLFNRKSETVIAMAITSQSQKAGFPLTLELPEDMLPKPSWVKISQIRTISIDSAWQEDRGPRSWDAGPVDRRVARADWLVLVGFRNRRNERNLRS